MADSYYTTEGGLHKLNDNGQLLWSISGKGVDRLFEVEIALSKISRFAAHAHDCYLLPDNNCTCGLSAIRENIRRLRNNEAPAPLDTGAEQK